ncbi:hypothetical protein [Streptomyces sp. NPDC001893]|uniref:hypothetical protein n=1 Tax=Streptomyces sp. NPDC001893 TaxID=3154530 RepID=UPI0033274624
MVTNLARNLVRTAAAHPDRPVLSLDDQVLDCVDGLPAGPTGKIVKRAVPISP